MKNIRHGKKKLSTIKNIGHGKKIKRNKNRKRILKRMRSKEMLCKIELRAIKKI